MMGQIVLYAAIAVLALGVSASAAVPKGAESPVFAVPRLEGIQVDGKTDDWGDKGFRVEVLANIEGQVRSPESCDAQMRLGWNKDGLLVLLTVSDDSPVENADEQLLYADDSVELFLAPFRGSPNIAQWVVAPGLDAAHPEPRSHFYDLRADPKFKKYPADIRMARTRTKGGYVMEVLLPWSALAIEPKVGREVAFQIYVNYVDLAGGRFQRVWYPRTGSHMNSEAMHRIRLAETADEPVVVAATARHEHLARVRVDVLARRDLAGMPVTVRCGGKTLAEGVLAENQGWAAASLRGGEGGGAIEVQVGKAYRSVVVLPELAQARAQGRMEVRPVFQPSVFSGETFPPCEFQDPAGVEALIGPHTMDVVYYDAQGERVTKASRPGRYGAIVTIRAADGRTLTRYATLYRLPAEWRWWTGEVQGAVELPKELGIDPAVAAAYRANVSDVLRWAFGDQANISSAPAVLLAGLAEAKVGDVPSVYTDPRCRDRQWWVDLKRRLNGNAARFAKPLARPGPIEGKPATVLHEGTLQEAEMKPDAAKRLDAVLTKWAADTDEAFIVCIARHGVIVLHKAYGTRDGRPMTTETKSWMASLTKLLSGSLVMMFVDQGLVDLNAPVDAYLPEFKGVALETPITLRHLFTHTAGMWDHWGDDLNDFEHLVAEFGPHLEVGKKFEYNGMDLALAGKALEQVSGECLPLLYKRHLLDPLGCTHTDVTNGSGDGQSTALDFAKVGQMLLNRGAYGDKRFFRPETFEKMLPERLTKVLGPDTVVEWGIGCTWFRDEGLSDRTFAHGAASSATLRIDQKNDLVISMTRNSAGKNFGKYHKKFLETVVAVMLNPVGPSKP